MNNQQRSGKWYCALYLSLFFFSLSSVMSKLSSGFELMSIQFLFLYGMSIAILFIYAVVWQQILKHFPLSTAYANKPVATLMSMIWGVVLFDEHLTWNMIVGAAVLMIGIRIMVTADD